MMITTNFTNVNRKEVKDLKNIEIRAAAKEKGVRLWQIAETLKISEPTLTRKLRHELPDEYKEKIRAIIEELAQKGA